MKVFFQYPENKEATSLILDSIKFLVDTTMGDWQKWLLTELTN